MKICIKNIKVNTLEQDMYNELISSTYLILSKLTGKQIFFISTPE